MSKSLLEVRVLGAARWLSLFALLSSGCHSGAVDDPAPEALTSVRSALSASGVTSANLQLQVSKNACAGNVAQDYFKVTNATGGAVPLSQVAIRYWINDTSAANIVPAVYYGGCVTSPNGTCVHPVTGVTASATRVSPACGGDANHQASWEITISTTDTTPLAAGQIWSNLQTAVNLANHANFVPGSSTWFSGCGTGQPYAANSAFAVYLNGDLVQNGVAVPLCRAPGPTQIQAFIDASYYSTSDVRSSFISHGDQVDCIDFTAQHSVKAWTASGVAMPTTLPAPPDAPPGMRPVNFPAGFAFEGQPDVNGHPQSCPAGQVPVSRPTVAQIQAAGGVAAFVQAQADRRRMLSGAQSPDQHDCWLNNAPGNGGVIGSNDGVDWEHAAGVQTTGFLPAGAPGFYGAHTVTPIYSPLMDPAGINEHTDTQFWIQSGICEDWYPTKIEIATQKNQCKTGAACTGCSGAACANCAVQSMEIASFVEVGKGPRLAVFFTGDGYFMSGCFAGQGGVSCPMCPVTTTAFGPPSSGTLTEGTDCFVAMPGAKLKPDSPLPVNTSGPAGSQYGVAPFEIEFSVWNGSGTSNPGWWIYVRTDPSGPLELIGWYPPETFKWPDGSLGPLSNGPATYLQAGGEVFDNWPMGSHTSTSMVSDNAAQAGFQFAAYHRNMGYYDANKGIHDASLGYPVAPTAEGDNGIPGVCGLFSGGWTDAAGAPGGYTLSTTVPAGAPGWGQYMFFGGGLLANEKVPTASPVTITYHQYAACTGFATNSGGSSTGPNAAYVVFMIDGIDNSGNNVTFNFKQENLFVQDPHNGQQDPVDPGLMLYPNIFGPFAAADGPIAAFSNAQFQVSEDVGLVVSTSTSDGSVEANQTAYALQYQAKPGDPPVTMLKTNAGQTTFAGQADCRQIGLVF